MYECFEHYEVNLSLSYIINIQRLFIVEVDC